MRTVLRSDKSAHRSRAPHPAAGLTYSPFTALIFALAFVVLVGGPLVYLSWDRMPERIQNLPRRVMSQLNKNRPHPAYVPTVAAAAAPPVFELAAAATPTPTATSASEAPEVVLAENTPAPATATPPPPTPTPVPAFEAARSSITLTGVRHEFQKWNNCGPVTIGMQLSYFGRPDTQTQTAPFLKPNPDDKNVTPHELAAYSESIGFGTRVVAGGDLDLLKTLLTNGFPVVVEAWFIPDPNDEMGHYYLLVGYDDAAGHFIAHDSFHGPNQILPYEEFDRLWQVFNRTMVLSYPPEQEEMVAAILGERADEEGMYRLALDTAIRETQVDPNNKFAWFNIGSSYVGLGDMENAARAFDHARSMQLPWRMLWYQFGPFEAYFALGRYQDVIDLASANIKATTNLEESAYWRGRAFAAMGENNAARRDFSLALNDNSKFQPAAEALQALP